MTTHSQDELLKISRKMSYLLRHNPGSVDLEMSERGEVSLDSLAKAVGTSVSTVREIVESDGKGRYVIQGRRIWATQGHSISVTVQHERLSEVGIVFHGTKWVFLESIMQNGLVRGERVHVHLSADIDTAITVAGRRKGDSVILKIDGKQMLEDGHEILRSSNGVILTDSVPWEYVLEFVAADDESALKLFHV